MASAVTVCNGALIKVGAARIAALSENSVEARICNDRYEHVLKDLLRSHPWNFATKWVELAEVVNPPDSEYDYVFQLPGDCLRVIQTDCEVDKWAVEGEYIGADITPVTIQYIAYETDVNKWDDNFREVMSCKLAYDICYALAQSAALKREIGEEYRARLREARSFNGQEGSPPRVYANSWLNSRKS